MQFWIDYREPKARLDKFQEEFGEDCHIDDLGDNGGDWLFYREEPNRILEIRAEYKSVEGLLGDISTGRVIDQLHGLLRKADIPILVIGGFFTVSYPGEKLKTKLGIRNYNYFFLENWLHSRENEGIRVVRFPREGCEPRILRSLLNYYSDPEMNMSGMKPRKHTLPLLEKDKRLEVLCSFSEISITKGKNLIAAYPNLIDMFNADPKDLEQIKLIGPKTVKKMFEELGRSANNGR